jgi:predicted nucleic acid-binding protein
MYLLDTNVVSELRKTKRADKCVTAWASGVPTASLFLSAITILEIETGILLVERRDSRQASRLRAWLDNQVLTAFSGRILVVDIAVAQCCAKLHVPDRRSDRDALIAATALVHGLTVVTRNTGDFEQTGVALLNPWEFSPSPR